MVFIVFLAISLVIACHVDCTDGVPKYKINSRPNGFSSASGLDKFLCNFEVDECGFNNAFANIYALSGWLRICDKEGCSMRINAGDSTNTEASSTLVSPSFSGNSGVLSMRYYIPDKTNAKNASLGVYIRRSDRSDRKLIYLASSGMDRPWVPMAAELDRPWVPMSVDVHMDHTSKFKFQFEIDGFMEDSKENIFIDDFEFEQKDHPHD
ncbi:uncharacterized protein LOC117112111 isoform X2 [Anneissia japonica]|uniref:uncharacterized protein LOC117112111 isoform X2 n=1 Tax=Anneissia japonica TaxID=1529436 RepID=UPI001425A7AD|nr:uncharacterized protein LOC117112111 isoform X2 [Anneissia japonica]